MHGILRETWDKRFKSTKAEWPAGNRAYRTLDVYGLVIYIKIAVRCSYGTDNCFVLNTIQGGLVNMYMYYILSTQYQLDDHKKSKKIVEASKSTHSGQIWNISLDWTKIYPARKSTILNKYKNKKRCMNSSVENSHRPYHTEWIAKKNSGHFLHMTWRKMWQTQFLIKIKKDSISISICWAWGIHSSTNSKLLTRQSQHKFQVF